MSFGSPIIWRTMKRKTVAVSSTEAEYVALTETTQNCLWLIQLLQPIVVVKVAELYCDNQSSMKIAMNPINHPRTKHYDVKYHFIRDLLNVGTVKVSYVCSQENVADILAKPLNKEIFDYHKKMLLGSREGFEI